MKSIKTAWNLGLLYKNEKDPQIEKDLQHIEKACTAFEKKYKKANFTATPETLAKALDDNEALSKIFNASKPHWYFALRTDLNSADKEAGANATKYDARLTEASNKTTFFHLAIGNISKNKQKAFLTHPALLKYAYRLKKSFDHARYQLPEGEEQIIDLLSQTSYAMWVDGQEKVLTQQTVLYKGKQISIPQGLGMIAELPDKDRNELHKKIQQKLKEISSFAESEFNAVYNYKKVLDARRGYAKPYSSTVLGYENTEKEVEQLVAVITKHFSISKRFYRLQAQLLRKKKISYADRAAKIGEINKKYSFTETVNIVTSAFDKVDPMYGDMVRKFAENGQFDFFPRKGKKGGAYCWGNGDSPTFVLLNHTDTINSVETLGHEMGHAAHTELAKRQPRWYQKYSMATAETASTFFEQVTTRELEKDLSEEEKIVFLHNRIMGDISTIFRQVAFFNFELELHKCIRAEGELSKGDIAELMAKHLRSYMGDAADITHDDGYFFVYLSHARRFFYVYSYAYGQLVSRAMFEKWKEDPTYAKKVEQFLSAGRSMSPKDIFKKIGIDTTDPAFFEAGLKGIEADIITLEKLAKKVKSKKAKK